ncbi:hypothetical protein AB0B45_03890 [Nonomuraea sp. NPDC049152]|uniref:hypothetical protein n=1 Tax=Nonomuraea sp. NPDC049152 TaxID=3154350 RepID=UPI0033C69DC5
MNEKDAIDELIAALRPDALTEDAYRRRRSADLARAFESPRTPQHFRRFSMAQRRPLLVIAAAAAGLAAAAIVVPQLVSQDASPSGPATAQQPGVRAPSVDAGAKATTTGTAANTRTILLAAAKVAAEEPITSGTFWYSRVRTAQKVTTAPEEYMAKLEPLLDEWKAKETELKDKPAELKAAKKEFDEKVLQLKTAKLPYTAIRSETTEMWLSRKDASGRRVKNQDVKVEFATPEDEAKWKQAGSPRLSDDDRPRTKEGAPEGIMSIGNDSLTWSNISKLPTGKEELKAKLHDLYDQYDQSDRSVPLAIYMWQTGTDLLSAPITPGTRAALYQVLADSTSGLKSQTGVADGMGRTGVALETTGPDDAGVADGITYRLIFDDKTAKLLELDVVEAGSSTPLLRQTYEAMGYVGELGAKPAQ